MKKSRWEYVVVLLAVLALSSCASQPKDQIMLMPAPDVYDQGYWDPFTDHNPIKDLAYNGILYATDRKPAQIEGQSYLDDRGHVLRLGIANIKAGKEDMTWEEARRISLLKERPDDYPLKVTDVREIEILDRSINVLTKSLAQIEQQQVKDENFANKLNTKLSSSKIKDVFIYVPGFKVVFENPLLVATELWHFLGYEGVFIAFAWPSTPSATAYFSDLETAALSAGNLRLLIHFLAEETNARRIHIVGYSAGTRVVAQALNQISLMYAQPGCKNSAENLRIGHVILTGSDLDLDHFGSYLMDGMLDVVDNLTIYASAKDQALGMSQWVFGRQRLGQIVSVQLDEDATEYLEKNNRLVIVNATDTKGADTGNGHAYFRKSPETSSDILATLMFDLTPEQRGLVRADDQPFWTFPEDYIDRLRSALVMAQSKK